MFCSDKPDHGACNACYDYNSREFSSKGMRETVHDNLNSMRFGDYSTTVLAGFLVSIAAGREMQDVFHCRALRLSPLGQSQPDFHTSLKAMEIVRQYALLPVVTAVVPILIMHRES